MVRGEQEPATCPNGEGEKMRYFQLCVFAALCGCTIFVPDDDTTVADDDDSAGDDDTTDADDDDSADDDSAGDDDSAAEPALDKDLDGFSTVLDCDDSDPDINPGATEICDLLDNDCNGQVDDGLLVAEMYRDEDGDGYGAGDAVLSCGLEGFVPLDGDCNDQAAEIHPGAQDVPGDWIDQDCDDETGDDDDATPADDDDVADDDVADDDDDTSPTDDDDVVLAEDADQDGYSTVLDCDDNDPDINPGAAEICDGLDQDCDGIIPDAELDNDLDGWVGCEGVLVSGGDCDDQDASVHPGAADLFDGVDNDCDGTADEAWGGWISVTYGFAAVRTLNYQVYWAASDLGDWWSESVPGAGSSLDDLLQNSAWPPLADACGVRLNVTEGLPASGWYCEAAAMDAAVGVDIWWRGTDGQWDVYDESDLVVWLDPTATGGSCSALLIISSASWCQPS
jgi:hypothetical protein